MNLPTLRIDYIVLLSLALLPIIWWVSRLKPRNPKTIYFPAKRFLIGLESKNTNAASAPVWLKILRTVGLAFLILAIAGPSLDFNNKSKQQLPEAIIIVFEDSYSAAPSFEFSKSAINSVLASIKSDITSNTQFYFIPTSIGFAGPIASAPSPMTFHDIQETVQNHVPKPIFFDHKSAAEALNRLKFKAKIYYFSDGLDHNNSQLLVNAMSLKSFGNTEVFEPKIRQNFALSSLKLNSNSIDFEYVTGPKSSDAIVDFYSSNHIILASAKGSNGIGRLNIDNSNQNIARKIAYAKIRGANSAASAFLLDSFEKRPLIGIEKPTEAEAPLLSDINYIKAAANQFADISQGDIKTLSEGQYSAIIIGDRPGFSSQEKANLEAYIKNGGMLVRYIGPQATSVNNDELLSAKFKPEARNIKDALSVEPISIAPFSRESPLFGLALQSDANPNIIAVLDEESAPIKIWARLSDGTPLISARKFGKGEIVSIHTSAAPYWSDIAYSGLQPSILRRIIGRANSPLLPSQIRPTNLPLFSKVQIDGFGNVRNSPNSSWHDAGSYFSKNIKLPGIYENSEARIIKQAYEGQTKFEKAKPLPSSFRFIETGKNTMFDLAPFLLMIAFAILCFDMIFAANYTNFEFIKPLRNRFINLKNQLFSQMKSINFSSSFLFLAFGLFAGLLVFTANISNAQSAPKTQQTQQTQNAIRLGYLKTNEVANDDITQRGLEGLKQALNARTSVQAGNIIGLDAGQDELALYPIIYWRIGENPMPQSQIAQQKLNQYMRNGGLLFIDTRGAGLNQNQARVNTQIALRGLVVPPLEQIDSNHVLAKTFYLLSGFSGRYANAKLWAQNRASLSASANDGVSPIIIGDGDYAFAWANRNNIALNVGINVYLYALTGQYKADQVHAAAIMERQRARPK